MFKRFAITSVLAFGFFLQAAIAADIPETETAREYLIQVWQTENGLPQNWVSSIVQTPDGYLWVGTRYGGLARFDGVRFIPFNQQNVPELKDVQVEHLDVDQTGRLWIIMGNESITSFRGGRFKLQREPREAPHARLDHVLDVRSNTVLFAGEFPYLAAVDLSPGGKWNLFDPRSFMNPDPDTFLEDGDGVVWFITMAKRLARFANDRFEFVTGVLPEENAVALALDSARQLWIATPHHIVSWDGKAYRDHTPASGATPDGILQICSSGDGGLWVLERNRLRKLLNGKWTTEISSEVLSELTSGAFSLYGDTQGNAWLVANGRGLLHCKSDGTAHFLNERNGLPNRFITCWFQDAEGDIWIGMHGGGIARIRERLFHVFAQADGLPDKVVSSVCTDSEGDLWAGTMSGELARWQDGKFVNVPLEAPKNQPNESITVFPKSTGGLWVGSLNNGLWEYHAGKFSRLAPWDIRVLYGDNKNRLWVGRLVNLLCVTNDGNKTFGPSDGFADSHAIGALAEDADGALWIGTGPGELWKYSAGTFSRFTPPTNWPSVRFSAVLPDTNGTVWVGTLGGGLLRFQDGKFTRCLKEHGLPDNNVAQLLDSHDGFLWGGTYAGIFRANKKDLEAVSNGEEKRLPCRVYGAFDGLISLECSSGFQPSCWQSKDGILWFSTANGIASVDPSKTVLNPIPPTVIIEDMLVDGRPIEVPPRIGVPLEMARSKPIKVPPGRHYLQFGFTGLSFAAPDGVRFRVKLQGGDNEWQDVGGRREFGYGPLQPGNYCFRVIACNNDGVWNEDGDSLTFVVLPYFTETKSFKVGLAIVTLAVFAAAAAMIQRQRYRRRLELAERQREMEQERSRIARDLHDDLGTSLTQINYLSALADRASTPAKETKELIYEIRGRARDMVVALDEIVWAVNPTNDSLAGLVNYLGHFAEEFFRPSEIRLRLNLPSQVPEVLLTAEMRHHLFLAFKEALNNAARHSGANQVSLQVKISENEITIHIEDNGRGFDIQSTSSTGNGLNNMRRRLEQIGGFAEVRSAPGKGTSVIFHLPVKIS